MHVHSANVPGLFSLSCFDTFGVFQEELAADGSAFDSTSSFESVPQKLKAQKDRAPSTMAPPQAREPKKRKGTPHPKPRKVRRASPTAVYMHCHNSHVRYQVFDLEGCDLTDCM